MAAVIISAILRGVFRHLNLSLSIAPAAFCWPLTFRRDQPYTARTVEHRHVHHPPFLNPIRTLADILHYQALNALAPLPLPAAISYLFDIPSFGSVRSPLSYLSIHQNGPSQANSRAREERLQY